MRTNLALREYVPLIRERLQFAVRLVIDALAGQPPFYELARYDSTNAIGGGKGVRGFPARRYHGMLKMFTNMELRYWVWTFDLFAKSNRLGLVGFADAGRVWADYGRLSELDGDGLGLKIGFGGGLRVLAGQSFVVRADLATSADSGISGYLAAGHMF
jgi:hemolysin activation/secretion protein